MATYNGSSAIPLDKSAYFNAMEKEGRGSIANMGALVAERERMKNAIEQSNRLRKEARDARLMAGQGQFAALGVKESAGGIYDWITGTPQAGGVVPTVSGNAPTISGGTGLIVNGTTLPLNTSLPNTMPTLGVNTTLAEPLASTAIPSTGAAGMPAWDGAQALNPVLSGTEEAAAGISEASSVAPTADVGLASAVTPRVSLLGSGAAGAGTGAAFSSMGAVAGGLGAAMGGYSLATSQKARKSPGTWLQTAGGVSMMIPGGQLLGGAAMGIGALMNIFGWEI